MISPVKIWRNQKKIQKLLGLEAKIVSFTRVHVPPVGFISQAPYVIIVAEFNSGRRYTAQLVDGGEHHLKIGQKVISVLRKTRDPSEEGVIPYGVKFRPIG
ncbi:OB-fold domain-containing protein [Candidatus Gottesmanbacteria bacterium]|nr:OB-fold domain-containing protein [Candidatus Gottesmanbacteria bacterium]